MQGRLLNDEIQQQVAVFFEKELINPVVMLYFHNTDSCDTCDQTRQLLEEVAETSDLLSVTVYDVDQRPDLADEYSIQLTPAIVIAGKDGEVLVDYGIRFLGIPSGYEFSSLIHTISLVSRGDSGLQPDVRRAVREIYTPINLRVFVTPT